MSFSAYKRRVLVGWLRDIADEGKPMPSARAIATRLDFSSVGLADDIVNELIADGLIAVDVIKNVRCVRVLTAPGAAIGASASSVPPHLRQQALARATAEVARQAPAPAPPAVVPDRLPPTVRRRDPLSTVSKPTADGPPAPAARVAASESPVLAAVASPATDQPRLAKADKPLIRADVIRSARDCGQPLGEFVTALIDIGFAEWRKIQGRT